MWIVLSNVNLNQGKHQGGVWLRNLNKTSGISKVHKKTFKEAFITDKTSLDKRQRKYSKPKNFLLIVEGYIWFAVCISGKCMAYGKGIIAEDFDGGWVRFNKDDYYIHKNPHNFEEEKHDEKLSENTEDIVEEEQEEEKTLSLMSLRRRKKYPQTPD